MIGVYKIQSKSILKAFYIGGTIDLKRRKRHHWQRLLVNKNNNKPLQNHCNQFGLEDLEFIILEVLDNDESLTEREQYYIDTLNPSFNIARYAGTLLGTTRTEEEKKKMSAFQKGKPGRTIPMDERVKISERMKGNNYGVGNKNAKGNRMSAEAREKISQKLKGRKYSDEHKEKIVAHRRKGVVQIKDGCIVSEWPSLSEAGRTLKMSIGRLCTCIKDGKEFKGFIWKYKNVLNEAV